jgi:hypothetical protein
MGARAAEAQRIAQRGGVQPQRIGPEQPPLHPQPPGVAQREAPDYLAPRRAAEHQAFHRQQARIAGQRDFGAAIEGCAVEQDGFLRDPFQRRARPRIERDVHARGGAEAAIHLLGRRRGQRQPRLRVEAQRHAHVVAARQPAAGIEQGGDAALVRFGVGQQQAQRRGLRQLQRAGAAQGGGEARGDAAIGALVARRGRGWLRRADSGRLHASYWQGTTEGRSRPLLGLTCRNGAPSLGSACIAPTSRWRAAAAFGGACPWHASRNGEGNHAEESTP